MTYCFSRWLAALCFAFCFGSASLSAQESGQSTEPLPSQALIQALEDPDARARLIEALRETEDGTETLEPTTAEETATQTLATQAARFSQQLFANVGSGASRVFSDLGRLALLPQLLTPERAQAILNDAIPMLLTILITVVGYRSMRWLTGRIRIGAQGGIGSMINMTWAFSIQVVLRVVSVFLAWIIGYLAASFFLSNGEPTLAQALYLNAFLIFGFVTAALSTFVSDDPRDMTFASMAIDAERVIYRGSRRVLGLFIYGLVAVAPISQIYVNFVFARSMRTLVVTVGAVAALYAIFRIRKALLREVNKHVAEDEKLNDGSLVKQQQTTWLAVWPWLASLYVFVSYGVALASPNRMVELIGIATLLTAIGLGSFLIAMRFFGAISKPPKLRLPKNINKMLPPLEERLSGFLPFAGFVGGIVFLVIAGGFFLEGWHLVDLSGWLTGTGSALVVRMSYLLLGILSLVILWSVLTAWIDTRLSEELSGKQVTSRLRTLLSLFKNVVSIALVIFGGMTVLSELGINIAPLLAGAGVLGLAIGFGAQKLVQDIITGIFIQLENAINEGDVVTVAGITGGVEKLTIRSVGIRDVAGTYHLIPFSSVDTVGNFMRRFAFHVEVVGIAYDSDIEAAKEAMHRAYDTLKAGPMGRDIIAALEWHGVVALGDNSVNLRARIKTKPGLQWGVGRAYTEQVKKELDAAGVDIPFPHRELKLPKEFLERLRPQISSAEAKA